MFRKLVVCLLTLVLIFTMIPAVALATESPEMSDEFKAILNEDGELVLDCAPPRDDDEATFLICEPFAEGHEWLFRIESFNSDYTTAVVDYSASGDFSEITESHTVKINYNYDLDLNSKVKSFSENLSGKYTVTDLEIVNYLVNKGTEEGLIYYSGEFKKAIDYTNLTFNISERAGDDFPLLIMRKGVGTLSYNGISYATLSEAEANGHFVLYVSDETENTQDALLEAAQKRVNEYFGNDEVFKLSYAGKLTDIWIDGLYNSFYHDTNEAESRQSYDEWFDEYIRPDADTYLDKVTNELGVSKDVDTYEAEVNGKTYQFLILRDSSKMLNPEYKGKNIDFNVEISTNNSTVPLDSIVEADVVSNGSEYDRIHSVLDLEVGTSYDLGLYSNSIQNNVTKLENGKFLVKIPVPYELEGCDLVVYYVDANNDVTEHEVTVVDGYAEFETDHFSIYTLTEKIVAEDTTPNGDTDVPTTEDNNVPPVEEDNNVPPTEDNDVPEQKDPVEEKPETDVPPTGDNNSLVLWAVVALTSLVAAMILRKREE